MCEHGKSNSAENLGGSESTPAKDMKLSKKVSEMNSFQH